MENPVFILGSHKSGTSLLRSLLDGAEELFIIPVEGHFFQYSGYWVNYALRRSFPEKIDFDDLVERFTRHIRRSNEVESITSDSILTGCWDVDLFVNHLRTKGASSFEKLGFRGLLDSYVEAIHLSLYGWLPDTSRFVEKSVENAEYAAVLKKLYPGAKFIHMLRNPYATLVALRKHMMRKRYPFLGNAISALNNSYYYLYKNPLIVSDYLVLRYEDLLAKPLEVMLSVSKFIGIEFNDSLLEPTVMTTPWKGNSTSGQEFDSISTRPLWAWRKEIYSIEVEFVNLLFSHILRDYAYERLRTNTSIYCPVPRDSLKSYLSNRLLWKLTLATQ
jgi:hypothetical protein